MNDNTLVSIGIVKRALEKYAGKNQIVFIMDFIEQETKERPAYMHEAETAYTPTCPRGYTDCICDPAYIKYNYPEWYAELYGDMSPEEAAEDCRQRDEDYYCYDDEDK